MSTASYPRHAGNSLRLTFRGRVVIVVVTLALLFVGITLCRAATGHADTGATRTAVVGPGDTLWSLATRVAPDTDPRAVIAKIRVLNHLSSADVYPGQRLELPA